MRHALRSAVLLAAALLTATLGAAEIAEHTTRLDVGPDGAGRGVTTIAVTGLAGETLAIPVVPGWANLRLGDAPEGLRLEPPRDKATSVKVTLPPPSPAPSVPASPAPAGTASVRFALVFDVPEAFAKPEEPAKGAKLTMPRDARTLKVAFVNTQAPPIKTFGVLTVLPDGWRFHAIREQLPKIRKSETEPRVRLGGEGGRQTAFLQLAGLKQGDSASMQVEASPNARSPLWLAAGLALSALYLVKFRDLVSKDGGSAATR